MDLGIPAARMRYVGVDDRRDDGQCSQNNSLSSATATLLRDPCAAGFEVPQFAFLSGGNLLLF